MLLVKNALVYDFGGGEGPDERATHIVDELPENRYRSMWNDTHRKYTQQDITKPFIAGPPGNHVNISDTINNTWLDPENPDHAKTYNVVVENIHNHLLPGGTVHIKDELRNVNNMVVRLKQKGYTVVQPLKTWEDEWSEQDAGNIILKKP